MSNNYIDYEIVNENCDISKNIDSFKEIIITKKICIPAKKPDIVKIIKVKAEVNIENTRLIKTPEGTSLDGLCLTGKKLVIEGDIIQQINYVADSEDGQVYYSQFRIPFSIFIVMPEKYIECKKASPFIVLENISVGLVNRRTILSDFTLLAMVEI